MINKQLAQMLEKQRIETGFYDKYNSETLGLEEMILDQIKTRIRSKQYKNAVTASKYYNYDHDIKNRRIVYKMDGQYHESNLANRKIKHPYHRLLTDQKISHMTGNFTINHPEKLKVFDNVLDDEKLNSLAAEVVLNASNNGEAYIHYYINQHGDVDFCVMNSLECIPIYDTSFQQELTEFIRFYEIEIVKSGVTEKAYNIEYYTNTHVTYFTSNQNFTEISYDPSHLVNPAPYAITYSNTGKIVESGFDTLPFVVVKNNFTKSDDLQAIKDLVDEYDIISSDFGNELENEREGVWVFTNIGQAIELSELILSIKGAGGVKLPPNCTVEKKSFPVAFEARKELLDKLKNSIYEIGQGVDINNKDILGNATGIAIKLRFSALDMKCTVINNSLKDAFYKLATVVLQNYNLKNNTSYDAKEIDIRNSFNVLKDPSDEKMETETVIMLFEKGAISHETTLDLLKQITDTQQELNRLASEKSAL